MTSPLQRHLPGAKSRAPDRPAGPIDPTAIKATLRQAQQLAGAGRSLEAIDRVETVLRADPQNVEALFLVGLIASQIKVFDMAIDYLTRAMKLQPNNATIRHYLGKVHLDDADPERAERHLKKAVSLVPDRPRVLMDLARCYEVGGKPGKAISPTRNSASTFCGSTRNTASTRSIASRLRPAPASCCA